MIFNTEQFNNDSLKLIQKYGRETVVRAERLALEQANIYRPLTEPFINCFLRERDVFCRIINEKKDSQ